MPLLVILLILFLVVGGIGIAIKGLVWLAIVGLALFVITGVVGWVKRASLR